MQIKIKLGAMDVSDIRRLIWSQCDWMREVGIQDWEQTLISDYPNNQLIWNFKQESDVTAFALRWL